MGSQTVHSERFQLGGPGQLWAAVPGTITSAYAPTAVGGQFVQGVAAATNVPGFAAFIPMGDFGSPVSIDYSITVEEVTVENSLDTVTNLVTKRMLSIKPELVNFTTWQLQLAYNAAASAVSGTPAATTVAKITPPAPGQEQRWQLLWQSNDNTDLIVVYQALQVGSVSEKRGKGAAGRASLSLEFKAELPPAATATSLFNRWRCGVNAAGTLATDI